ncbi:MAG: glycosyltransferase [Bacteroidetes bacterium]|nr:glycosyltransferase [Bacteroidota bacterium]
MPDNGLSRKKISIVIPALNEEKLIRRTLSQFEDNFKKDHDLEIIVSDGGSTDKTPEISEELADRVILKNKNIPQNISRGRNEGAKNSSGDVLVFLNADTYIKDIGYFMRVIETEFSGGNISALACRIKVFPDEEILSDRMFHGFYNNYVRFLNKFLMGMGRGECHIVLREKFFEVKGYDEKMIAGEDFDLYRRLRKTGKIKFIDDLIIYESPRRYRKYGYTKVFWNWTINSISVFLFNRSVSKSWDPVR